MPLGLAASTLIGAGLSSGAGILGAHFTNKANKEMAELSWKKNMEMLDYQNAYNHPNAQMQRLKEAGLNPNLVYGETGAGATGQMKDRPKYEAPEIDWNAGIQNAVAAAQVGLIKAQTAKTYGEAGITNINKEIIEETKEDAKTIIRADRAIKNAESLSSQVDAIFNYYLSGGEGYIKPGNAFRIEQKNLKESPRYLRHQRSAEKIGAETRIVQAEADLNEVLRKYGANNATIQAVVSLFRAAISK